MDNKKFKENVEMVLKERNMKQQELAQVMGVSYQHLNAVLNGRMKLTTGIIISASKALDMKTEELYPREGMYSLAEPIDESQRFEICGIPILRTKLSDKDKNKRIMRASEVKAPIYFRLDWLYQKGEPESMSFIRTNVPCLDGEIPDAALVLVDLSQTSISNWGVYLVTIRDELQIRRLIVHKGEVKSVRTSQDSDQDIKYEKEEELKVIGRCIWYGKDLI